MSSKDEQKGVHIEHTTLLPTIDALRLVKATRRSLLTGFHLLALSQFIEAIVLHDALYYEEGETDQWSPYLDVIEESGIQHILGRKLVKPHQNSVDTADMELPAILWACDQIHSIDKRALAFAVEARKSSTRGVAESKGVEDSKNPFIFKYINIVESSGDETAIAALKEARRVFNEEGFGDLGLHVLIRIRLLLEWINSTENVSYLPNISRVPVVESVACESPRPTQYRMWSVKELRRQRRKLIEKHYERGEYTELTFKLSPIFVACLKDARSPLGILEEAFKMRNGKYAERFRKACSKLESEIRAKRIPDPLVRRNLSDAIKDFNEELRAKKQGWSKWDASVSLAPLPQLTVGRTFDLARQKPGVAFLQDVYYKSLFILNAEKEIERIFGQPFVLESNVVERISRVSSERDGIQRQRLDEE